MSYTYIHTSCTHTHIIYSSSSSRSSSSSSSIIIINMFIIIIHGQSLYQDMFLAEPLRIDVTLNSRCEIAAWYCYVYCSW